MSHEPMNNDLVSLTLTEQCTVAYELWTSLLTAVVFATVRDHGPEVATELERRSINRHQKKHFLHGMKKVGLEGEANDVVRCAKYHYFSNTLGGLPMHYVEETPERVWIRYLAPYWMGDGPTQPSAGPAVLTAAFGRAPYLGWHANNGAFLGNDRLVFVHTQSLCDGDPWDAGYFTLHDRSLDPGKGYIRRVGEWGPPFDPDKAPTLPFAAWPAERRVRALRNYIVDFTASRCAVLVELVGREAAARVVEHAFTVVLAQRAGTLPQRLGLAPVGSALDSARYYAAVAHVSGDEVTVEGDDVTPAVQQRTSRLWRDEGTSIPAIDDAIARAWARTLDLHGDGLTCRREGAPPDFSSRWTFLEERHADRV